MQSSMLLSLCLALPLLAAACPAAFAGDTDAMATQSAGALPILVPTAGPGPLPQAFVPQADAPPPLNDGKIHGMVSVGVGTRGYREGAVALEGPLPNGGTFAIAVESAQIDAGRERRQAAPAPPAPN